MEKAAPVSTSLFIGQPLTEIVEYRGDVDDEDSTNTLYSQSSFESSRFLKDEVLDELVIGGREGRRLDDRRDVM